MIPAFAALLLSAGVPVSAPPPPLSGELALLRAEDLRLAVVGARLAAANRALCADRAPLFGMILHDLGQYPPGRRDAARTLFGLGEGIGVMAVLPGGPAERAGLRADDQILGLNDADLRRPAPARGEGASFDRMDAVLAQFAAAAVGGSLRLAVDRAGRKLDVVLVPDSGCAADFVLLPSNRSNAWADGRYVVVTTHMLESVPDDDELAFVVAHELAHNILKHRDRLDAAGVPRGMFRTFGANAARVRATEGEADRFALTLMRNAGYRPAAALSFLARYAPTVPHSATHAPARARIEALRQAIADMDRTIRHPVRPEPVEGSSSLPPRF